MNLPHPPDDQSPPEPPVDSQLTEFVPGSGLARGHLKHRREPQAPPSIPDHELLRVIGRGAYGEVWLARNIMGTHRAVKVVYRDNFDSDRPYEREFSGIQSFEPISRSHESQVDILHVGRNEALRCFYYVMELADDAGARSDGVPESGRDGTLPAAQDVTPPPRFDSASYQPRTVRSDLKLRGRYSFAEAVEISLALTTAVGHLHRHGLIHRDIKPANVIFVNGRPKLADIGLVTETGGTMSFVGTEGYLPPEGPGSVQADLFSLGKTLYEVATGKDRLEFPELPSLSGSSAEEAGMFELNEVLLKACHPDRARRYQTAAEMHADLVLLQAGKSVRRSRAVERRLALLTRVSVAGVILTSLLVAGYLYQRFQTREARRLALENRELAVKEVGERQRAVALLNTLQLKEAEHHFENDEAGKGVALLAHLLRQNPSNHIAAARLVSALNDRSFPLPIAHFAVSGELQDAGFSPNGQWLVTTAGNDAKGEAKIWDVQTGASVGRPMHHESAVLIARFSPDGRFLLTASKDGTARLWNASSGEPATPALVHDGSGTSVRPEVRFGEFSPDGRSFATCAASNVHLWKVPTGEPAIPPIDAGAVVTSVQFSSDSRRLLTTAEDLMVKLWDANTGQILLALEPSGKSPAYPIVARFSPDGSLVAAGGGDGVSVWSATTGELLHESPHGATVVSLAFSPDGLRIAAGDVKRVACVWDARTGQLLLPPVAHKDVVEDLQFDATGERLLTLEWRRARLWDSRTGRPLTEWLEEVHSVRFSPDGSQVISKAGGDKTAVLWDVRPGQALNVTLWHQTSVSSAKFSRDGKKAVTAAGGDVFFRSFGGPMSGAAVWDTRTGDLVIPPIKTGAGVKYAEFSPDGSRIVTASHNGEAQVWDAHTGAAITRPLKHKGEVSCARFSPDGTKVATASGDATVRIWDAQTGEALTDPLGHTGALHSVEFSPDGRYVLGGIGRTTSVRVWDVGTGKLHLEVTDGTGAMHGHFSPDGKRLVTASHVPRIAQVWDFQTGQQVGEPMKHQSTVWWARFSPDGQYVVTKADDQGSRVWDAETGKPVSEALAHQQELIGGVEFSPNSSRVVTAGTDGTMRVWDAKTGRPVSEAFHHLDMISCAGFSPDGNQVITASADGTARIWELPLSEVPVAAWVLDLAEAVVGRRYAGPDEPEAVPPTQLLGLKNRFLEADETDRHAAWARWLLADRIARPTSPSSSVISRKHLERLITHGSLASLRQALHLSPENEQAIAALARLVLSHESAKGIYRHPRDEGRLLAERAEKLRARREDRQAKAETVR